MRDIVCHSFILGFQIKFISSLKLSNVPSEFNTFFNDSLSGHMEMIHYLYFYQLKVRNWWLHILLVERVKEQIKKLDLKSSSFSPIWISLLSRTTLFKYRWGRYCTNNCWSLESMEFMYWEEALHFWLRNWPVCTLCLVGSVLLMCKL